MKISRKKSLSKKLVLPLLLIEIAAVQVGLMPPAAAEGPGQLHILCQTLPWLPFCSNLPTPDFEIS